MSLCYANVFFSFLGDFSFLVWFSSTYWGGLELTPCYLHSQGEFACFFGLFFLTSMLTCCNQGVVTHIGSMEKGTSNNVKWLLCFKTLTKCHQVTTCHGSLKAAHGCFCVFLVQHFEWCLQFCRYFADDDSVTETNLGQVLAAQAYILFYSSTALSP